MTRNYPVTVHLSTKEADTLLMLSTLKGVSKAAIIRQALRLYAQVAEADTVELIVNGERKVVML